MLRGVSLQIEQGSVLTMFGPNGAGKTTLLKIVAGLLRPLPGRVHVEGIQLRDDPTAYRRSIGVISHHPYLYPQLTGLENLVYYGRLYGVREPRSEADSYSRRWDSPHSCGAKSRPTREAWRSGSL